jgi:hypothetical protein
VSSGMKGQVGHVRDVEAGGSNPLTPTRSEAVSGFGAVEGMEGLPVDKRRRVLLSDVRGDSLDVAIRRSRW